MLVLSRQRDQSIIIGHDIELRVVDIRGDKVRLGFLAPQSISIHRKEVYESIRRENQAAAQIQPGDVPGVADSIKPLRAATLPSAIVTENATMDDFMRAALDEARQGLAEGGLPIGSVLVRNGAIIARGHNRRIQHKNPMAHAEIDALTNAGLQTTYKDTVLYSTLMPCFLCTGAVLQFGIPKVVVGESVNFPGGEGLCGRSPELLRKAGVEVVDLRDGECIEMMSKFIRENPDVWFGDIGK